MDILGYEQSCGMGGRKEEERKGDTEGRGLGARGRDIVVEAEGGDGG